MAAIHLASVKHRDRPWPPRDAWRRAVGSGLRRFQPPSTVIIRAEGNRVRHYLNGRLILDFTDEDPDLARSKGVVALQLHDGRPTWAEFRTIRLKAL